MNLQYMILAAVVLISSIVGTSNAGFFNRIGIDRTSLTQTALVLTKITSLAAATATCMSLGMLISKLQYKQYNAAAKAALGTVSSIACLLVALSVMNSITNTKSKDKYSKETAPDKSSFEDWRLKFNKLKAKKKI